jgi:REP element-mobilizing transposase RayT
MSDNITSRPGYAALRRGRFSENGRYYHITTVTYERTPWFFDLQTARAAIIGLREQERQTDSQWLAWVLMPDHFHGLLQLGEMDELSRHIAQFKGRSAHIINCRQARNGPVWQRGFHDHALRRDEDLKQVARYIIANPLRARLVGSIGEYPHWDAVWL